MRAGIRPLLAKETKADQFLANWGISLGDDAYRLFLDCLLDVFIQALSTLEARAKGDYSPDTYLEQFPKFEKTAKLTQQAEGLTCWKLFEVYVAARKPARSTVNRQRAVFKSLQEQFQDKPISAITPDDAHEWAEGLLRKKPAKGNKKIGPRTVNEIYCSTANTVFNWAVNTRKLSRNPFQGIRVTEQRRIRTRETDEFTDAEVSTILNAASDFPMTPKKPFDAARR